MKKLSDYYDIESGQDGYTKGICKICGHIEKERTWDRHKLGEHKDGRPIVRLKIEIHIMESHTAYIVKEINGPATAT